LIIKKYGDNNNQKSGTKKCKGNMKPGNISGTSISWENLGGKNEGSTILRIENSVTNNEVIKFPFFLKSLLFISEKATRINDKNVKIAGTFQSGK